MRKVIRKQNIVSKTSPVYAKSVQQLKLYKYVCYIKQDRHVTLVVTNIKIAFNITA